ncbi:MAG TPA: glycosyltransferase family 4 protein [Gammaproteobacteria bacterium]|nr:glycosyltransferase family 4 protein [Gammaproteobacteria bacterium]
MAVETSASAGGRRVYWLEPDVFDTKPNKSPWVEMSRGLKAHGYDVVIVTGYAREPYRPAGGDVRFDYVPCIKIPCLQRFSLLLSMLPKLMSARKDDIVIVSPSGLIIAPFLRALGIRNIHLDVRTVPVSVHPLKGRAARLLYWRIPMGRLHRWARGASFITARLKQSVEQEFRTLFEDSVIWESGVNAAAFRLPQGQHRPFDSRVRTIFYHGSIAADRGIDTVIEALASLDAEHRECLRFVIVGDGGDLARIKRLAEKRGLKDCVVFEGLKPYEEMPRLIAQADVCICPLPNRPEWNVSSPLKVFEYMACGKPIIVTPIPAHRAVLDGQDFVVWTQGFDAPAFKEAIVYALENVERLAKAAASGPAFVESRYDWRQQAAKLAEYLERKFATAAR